MGKLVSKMVKVSTTLSRQQKGAPRCCVCDQTMYNIKVSPYAHNYVIDMLPESATRFSEPEKMEKQPNRLVNMQPNGPRKFYVTNVQMTGTSGCIPVEFCHVHNCKTDLQALGKLVFLLDPEVRFYGDSAYE